MNVFVSETCYRQVFGSVKGSSSRRVDDFNQLVRRLQQARDRADLNAKGLGTKKYRNVAGDVHGFDLNNGLTAERVIFRFVDASELADADGCFDRYADAEHPGAESVLLYYCSEHDSQHRHAVAVGRGATQGAPVQIAAAMPALPEEAREVLEDRRASWRMYGPGDLQRFGRPRTPVLTSDKFQIIARFASSDSPMLVTGSAGSGKTELGLRIIQDRAADPACGRMLYVTGNPFLVEEVAERLDGRPAEVCDVLTVEALMRRLSGGRRGQAGAIRFARRASFDTFWADFGAHGASGGQSRKRVMRLADSVGVDALWSEICATICGGMGPAWDRLEVPADPDDDGVLGLAAYLATPARLSHVDGPDARALTHDLARRFSRWCAARGLIIPESLAAGLAASVRAPRYDLVVVDEVQDLGETTIELLHRLGRSLFMTGDLNQVLSASAFEPNLIGRMDPGFQVVGLEGNFRNPRRICHVANAVGGLRATSRRLPAHRVEAMQPEVARNMTPGMAALCCPASFEQVVDLLGEASNIALITDAATVRRLRPGHPNVFTAREAKGMEFANVVIWGLLSAEGDLLSTLWDDGPKDGSLHRLLNRLYVGITRSRGGLLIAEPYESEASRRFAQVARDDLHRIAKVTDASFDLDASARGYLEVADQMRRQGMWSAAATWYGRALSLDRSLPGGLDDSQAAYATRRLEACGVLEGMAQAPTAQRLGELERRGLWEDALTMALLLDDRPRVALLRLCAAYDEEGRTLTWTMRCARFEAQLKRDSLDLPDLLGIDPRYDQALHDYYAELSEELLLYASETRSLVDAVRKTMRVLRPQVIE